MADTSTLKYKVEGFDADHKVLFVTFLDENHKVNIGLKKFPTTQDELDAIVKPFAAPVETAAQTIATAKADDPSFIKSMVGKTSTTARYSEAAVIDAAGSSNDLVVGTVTTANMKSNIKASDEAYIKKMIAEVLAEQATSSAS